MNHQKNYRCNQIHPQYQMLKHMEWALPFIVTKTPSSKAETNVIQGGVNGSGARITGLKILSSNAETNSGYNPINPTNTNCSSDPRLLIACTNIPSSNTNCDINPQAPPCCVEPTSDKSCMQMKKADMSNINTNPQNVHVGQQFKIQATITNNLNSPIKFVGNICGTSPLNIEFDNNVQIQNTNTCQAISFTTLNQMIPPQYKEVEEQYSLRQTQEQQMQK